MKNINLETLLENASLIEKFYEFKKNHYYGPNVDVSNYKLEDYVESLKRNDTDKIYFYCEEENEILSYLEIEYYKENCCFITDLTTNKNYRKGGHASKILSDVLEYLENSDVQEIKIWVDNEKEFLHDFYKKYGFEFGSAGGDMTEYNLDLNNRRRVL